MVYHGDLQLLLYIIGFQSENSSYYREPPATDFNYISPKQNCFCGKVVQYFIPVHDFKCTNKKEK